MLERVGDEILKFEDDDTGTQVARVAVGHVCFATRVILTGPDSLTVGAPATYRAEYCDWQDNPLPNENRPIRVRAGEAEMLVAPGNGVAKFDVQVDYVPEGGKLVIEAVGDGFGCDSGKLEVTVNEA